MTSKDFSTLDLKMFLSLNEDKDYQDQMRLMANSLARFLRSNGLVKENIDVPEPVPDEFVLWHSQLTDEGQAFEMSGAIHRWMEALDRGTRPEKTTILERALKKMRERQ